MSGAILKIISGEAMVRGGVAETRRREAREEETVRTLKRWTARPGSWIALGVLCAAAVVVGVAVPAGATSSPAHASHYQLVFERRGSGSCIVYSFAVEGVATRCTSENTPLSLPGQDKSQGQSLGVKLYNPVGEPVLSGTVQLTTKSTGNAIGKYGNANVAAYVEMTTSGEKTWVVRMIVYC